MSNQNTPHSTEVEQFAKLAIEAAQIGAAILQEYAQNGFHVQHKDQINLVTEADLRSEQAIVEVIREAFPSHKILAEEKGIHTEGQSPYQWIIDPLDGTTNFAHGFPMYNVSIGLEYERTCILGVVLDPTRQELFVAQTGGGATLNGNPIKPSEIAKINEALLVTGFGYDVHISPDNNLDEFCRFTLRAQSVRRTGSAALDMCYVACGRFDGFWELKLNPWDTAAGIVIVQEAGGNVTNWKGDPFSIYEKQMVASNSLIHQEMLEVLQKKAPPS